MLQQGLTGKHEVREDVKRKGLRRSLQNKISKPTQSKVPFSTSMSLFITWEVLIIIVYPGVYHRTLSVIHYPKHFQETEYLALS